MAAATLIPVCSSSARSRSTSGSGMAAAAPDDRGVAPEGPVEIPRPDHSLAQILRLRLVRPAGHLRTTRWAPTDDDADGRGWSSGNHPVTRGRDVEAGVFFWIRAGRRPFREGKGLPPTWPFWSAPSIRRASPIVVSSVRSSYI